MRSNAGEFTEEIGENDNMELRIEEIVENNQEKKKKTDEEKRRNKEALRELKEQVFKYCEDTKEEEVRSEAAEKAILALILLQKNPT